MATGESKKAIVAALLANTGIAVSKFVAFLITGSGSMLAESAHSVADAGNQGLLLWGGHRAQRKATQAHAFGYARESYFAAFIVSVVLFTAGAGFALREGLHKLAHPEHLSSPAVAIIVLVVAIGLEIWSFRTAIHAARPLVGDRSWWTFVRQNKTAELTVVLLEDLAALVGLVLALAGVMLAVVTENPRWDAYGTIAIASLLAVIAVILAIETKSLLIGESVSPESETAIREALAKSQLFKRIVHVRTEHRGSAEVLVAAKVAIDPEIDAGVIAAEIDAAENRIRAAVPTARYIFIEPDVEKG